MQLDRVGVVEAGGGGDASGVGGAPGVGVPGVLPRGEPGGGGIKLHELSKNTLSTRVPKGDAM